MLLSTTTNTLRPCWRGMAVHASAVPSPQASRLIVPQAHSRHAPANTVAKRPAHHPHSPPISPPLAMALVVGAATGAALVRAALNAHQRRVSHSEALLQSMDASPMAAPVVLTGLGEDPTELLAAPEFDTIFDLFDRDGNGAIDFREASLGMKKLVPSLAMLDARSRALDVFLLFDNDASRTLDRFEFARFLSRFSVLAGEPFASLAPRLVALLRADDALTSADYHDAALLQSQPDTQLYATLSRRKLDDLFDLMDHDGDGLVSTDVLQARLHALLQVARLGQGARVAAEACAVQELAAMGGSLTPRQFHGAMARVADSARLQLREVADAMLVLPEDVHVG